MWNNYNRWYRLMYGNTGSYGVMTAISRPKYGPWQGAPNCPPTTFGRVKRPETTMLIADNAYNSTFVGGSTVMGWFPSSGGSGFYGRHMGGDNILFVGGNAEWFSSSYPRLNLQLNNSTFNASSGRGAPPFSWHHYWGF